MPHVYLDPDGTEDLGMLLIVAASTGVTYETQCDGVATDQKSLEGFLIPLGQAQFEKKFWNELFCDKHLGNHGPIPWLDPNTAKYLARLEQIVAEIVCWKSQQGGNEERSHLTLDRTRIDECVEAWIPVLTPYGRGILTLKNSD